MKAQEYVQERLTFLLNQASKDGELSMEQHEQLERLIQLSILERLTYHLENNQVAVIVTQGERWQVRAVPTDF